MPTIDVISRANSEYLERIYQQYQADPRTVSPEWRAYFAGFEMGKTDGPARTDAGRTVPRSSADGRPRAHPDSIDPALSLTVELADLVHSYRELGHYVANLDPLGHNRPSHPLLELSEFGLRLADLDRRVGASTFLGPTDGTLRDLIAKLRTTYCGTIGVEYMDISNKQQRGAFGQGRMEMIVEDGLPKGAYEFQFTLSNNTRPDCAIHFPDQRPLIIDAKFPLEAVTAFRDAKTDEARRRAAEKLAHLKDVMAVIRN